MYTNTLQDISELARNNPALVVGGLGGALLLAGYALYKFKYISASRDGNLVMKQDNQVPSSHLKKIDAKENIISVATGSDPNSSVTNAKSQGSIESYAIDSSMSKESIEAMSTLVKNTQNPKKRKK